MVTNDLGNSWLKRSKGVAAGLEITKKITFV